MEWPVWVGLLAAGLVLIATLRFAARRRVRHRLRGREPLDDESFSSLFPSQLEGEIAVSARKLLAPMVSFDVTLIRPEDKPAVDLGLGSMDGLDANEFLASVERHWKVKVPAQVALQLRTVADVAGAVAQRVEHTRARRMAASSWSPTLPARLMDRPLQ